MSLQLNGNMTNEQKSVHVYFAIQIHRYESNHEMAEKILKTSHDEGHLFRELEVMDRIEVGSTTFLRCRADLDSVRVDKLLEVFRADKRSTIGSTTNGYILKFASNAKTGTISYSIMNVVPKSGTTQLYRGPKIKHWERQFLKGDEE